jgi:dTDP-4-dehydrorhamnose reductase
LKVLITGSKGQLGWELQRCQPAQVSHLVLVDLPEFDLTNHDQVAALFSQHQFDCVINCAAYTAVDKAESDQATAFNANATAPGQLAAFAKIQNSRFIQISTDFVFDGSQGTAYEPDSHPNPLSVYGASKLAGEKAVLDTYPNQSLVIRTAWVYSAHGGNFPKTMVKLMGERETINVVSDQIGTPTWARGLAQCVWQAAVARGESIRTGIVHFADAGTASWYDFAVAIQEESLAIGLLTKSIPIIPIPASQYPTPARRPSFSVMNRSSGWALAQGQTHWRVQLRKMLLQLKELQHG